MALFAILQNIIVIYRVITCVHVHIFFLYVYIVPFSYDLLEVKNLSIYYSKNV